MNANELADIVDHWAYKEGAEYLTDAANMLRQQADRIRNLEKTLGFKNSGYETINLTPPVAWINLDRFNDEALYLADCVSETKVDNMGITTPLYTHPVKELTKEPICWAMIRNGDFYDAIHPLEHLGEEGSYTVPLYDHPVKELTDEEIAEVFDNTFKVRDFEDAFLKFARAILRKAQEK